MQDLIPLVLSFIKLASLPLRRGEEVFDLGPAGVRVGGDTGDHGIEGAPHRFRDHLVGMATEIEHPARLGILIARPEIRGSWGRVSTFDIYC